MLDVVAAAVLSPRGLLVVSKQAAPDVFFLPGGKPDAGEAPLETLRREVTEELGVGLATVRDGFVVTGTAALEGGPMTLRVLRATLDGEPTVGAELAHLAWWPGELELASAIRDVVVPRLRATGELPGPGGERLERVTAAATAGLRAAVLRPGLGPASLAQPDDDAPETAFFAVVAGDEVVATANVRPRAPSWAPEAEGWWQLRGMATAPAARGRGHGATTLWAAVDHVAARGGRVWCNARVPAMGLYERAGFVRVGESWEHPERGPHRTMLLPPSGAPAG